MMTVAQLKSILDKVDDDVIVCIQSENDEYYFLSKTSTRVSSYSQKQERFIVFDEEIEESDDLISLKIIDLEYT